MERYRSNLKRLRVDAGLTQDELADATGVSRKTIILIESDQGSNPQIGTAKRLMAYFDIAFEDLYPEKKAVQ